MPSSTSRTSVVINTRCRTKRRLGAGFGATLGGSRRQWFALCVVSLVFGLAVVCPAEPPTGQPGTKPVVGYLRANLDSAVLNNASIRNFVFKNVTHIVYIRILDPNSDGSLAVQNAGRIPNAVSVTHSQGRKILACVEDWTVQMSNVCANATKRATLVKALIQFCRQYGFDGIDFDWEYPASSDLANFGTLLKELRAAAPPEFLVSVATGWWSGVVPASAHPYVDWFFIMAYGPTAPQCTYDQAVSRMNQVAGYGIPKAKLVLGLPLYGVSTDSRSLGYADIIGGRTLDRSLDELNGWSFNGPTTIERKTKFVYDNGFGGVGWWDVPLDTFDSRSLLLAAADQARTSAFASAAFWTGSLNANWSNGSNWNTSYSPNGNTAYFGLCSTNNLATTVNYEKSVSGVVVYDPPAEVSVDGQALTVGAGGIDLQWGQRDLTLDNPITLSAAQKWIVGPSRRLTANAPVSGGFALTKGGEGTLSLTAANTYTGGTTINNGTLRLDGGSLAGNIANHSLLVWNLSGSQTFGGTISGTGSVTKEGAGTLVLTNRANSFTGNVTVSGGTVSTGTSYGGSTNSYLGAASGSRTIAVSGGATLNFLDNNLFGGSGKTAATIPTVVVDGATLSATRFNILGNVTLANGAALTQSSTDSGIYQGYEFLGGTVTVSGSGAATISTGNGKGNHLAGGLTTTFLVAETTGDAGADLTVAAPLLDGSGDYSGAGALVKDGPGMMLLAANNTYTGATTLAAGRLRLDGSTAATSAWTVTGGTLAGTGTINGSFAMSGGTLALAGGATTTSLALKGGATFTNSPTVLFDGVPVQSTVYDVFTYGGMLAGAGNLKFPYRGTATDTGSKYTFTLGEYGASRTWTTTNGTWDTATTANFAEGDQLFYFGDHVTFGDIDSDAVVTLADTLLPGSVSVSNSANTYTFQTGTLGGTTGLAKSGAGALVLANNANSFTGDVTISGGTVGTGTSPGGGTNGYLGAVSGSRTITVSGGATLNFLANNQFGGSGKTAATIPTVVVNGATLSATRFNILGNVTLANGATLTQSSTDSGIYQGYEFLGGSVTVNGSGASTISTGNGKGNHLAGGLTTTFLVADTTGDAGVDLTVSAPLLDGSGDYAGAGALVKDGPGTMLLAANNAYTGNTTIAGGVLELAASGKMYNGGYNNSAVVTVKAGGTWKLPDYSYGGVGQLADYRYRRVLDGGTIEVTGGTHSSGQDFTVTATGGTLRYNPANTADTLTLSGNNNTDITVDGTLVFDTLGNITVDDPADTNSGIIAGSGGVTKTGNGTLTLNGSHSYGGATVVVEGTLQLAGSLAGPVTVGQGAILTGSGTIHNDLTLHPGAHFSIRLPGAPLTVAGNLNSAGRVDIADAGGFGPGTYTLFTYGGALTDTGLRIGTTPDANLGYALDTTTPGQVKLVVTSQFTAWQLARFGTTAGIAAADFDADGDGTANLIEYVAGTDPQAANPNPVIPDLETIDGRTYLRLSVARDANATGVVIEGLSAGNLVDWSTSTTVIETDTPALFRVRDSVPIGAEPQRFMRLRFGLP